MNGVTALGGVGAGLSQARTQVVNHRQVLTEQPKVTRDVGQAALKLISVALTSTEPIQYDLDVTA